MDWDDQDDAGGFTINQEYAKNYDSWRRKEEIQKMEDRYGAASGLPGSSEEDEETEDELAELDSADMERNFFRALSALKAKDNKIYDPQVQFFEEVDGSRPTEADRTRKAVKREPKMLLRDYERQRLLNERFEESDEDVVENNELPTYVEEQREIVKSFEAIPIEDDEHLFQEKEKSSTQRKREEEDYIQWLKGQKEVCNDGDDVSDMQYLRDYWNSEKSNEADTFLRDYLLNRRYREIDEDEPDGPKDVEVDYEEDEQALDAQENFERTYNFRFEEPSSSTILTYPRNIADSVRRKSDRRQRVRDARKERKAMEKRRQQEELKLLKSMKRKEIEEKLAKLKESAELDSVDFDEADLEADFDPDEHDRKMSAMFNDDYYSKPVAREKPTFSDSGSDEEEPPTASNPPVNTFKSIKRKVEQKKAEMGAEESKLLEECLEEYYRLDYEDMIAGEIPCRFPYRQVVANDFGLDTSEVLQANDKELNAWVSIKKISQYLPDSYERRLQHMYGKRARNEALKRKVLPSLYEKKQTDKVERTRTAAPTLASGSGRPARIQLSKKTPEQLKKTIALVQNFTDSRMQAYGVNPKKARNSIRFGNFVKTEPKIE